MKYGMTNGLIASAILSTLFLIINFIAPELNYSFIYSFISSTIIYFIFMIRASKKEKISTTGSFGFGEALITTMICYATTSLVYAIFTFLMIKFDPMQIEYAQEASLKSIETIANWFGNADGALIEQMEDSQEEVFNNFNNFGTHIINWFVSLIFPGLIYGAFAATLTGSKNAPIS